MPHPVQGRCEWFKIAAIRTGGQRVRILLSIAFGFNCALAGAAVTCEQLAELAVATQQLRDQGYSLPVVLAEADKLESSGKFTGPELERIRDVVEQAFKGMRSPLQILQECKDKYLR